MLSTRDWCGPPDGQYEPTRVHSDDERHVTEFTGLNSVVSGTSTICHDVPSQDPAQAPLSQIPTAVHAEGPVHEMELTSAQTEPLGSGKAMFCHDVPSQISPNDSVTFGGPVPLACQPPARQNVREVA